MARAVSPSATADEIYTLYREILSYLNGILNGKHG